MYRHRSLVAWLIALTLFATAAPARAQFGISDAELDQASRQEAYQAEQKYGLVNDPAVLARVEPVFQRVAQAARATRWPLQLKVLNDSDPNAFALPNGMMYVNRGLLEMPGLSDDELGFVLAHEISHVTLEHARKQINRAQLQGTLLSILAGGQNQWVQYLAQILHATVTSGYSRGYESEADKEALQTMVRSQLDPRGAIAFFHRLQQAEGQKRGGRIFPSHPLTRDRIRNVEKWVAANPDVMVTVTTPDKAEAGRLAPVFTGNLATGETWRLADHRGKKRVLVYFWDASVPMTVQGLDGVDQLARQAGDDVLVVAVHASPSAWAQAQAPRVIEGRDLSIPVVLDNGEANRMYGVDSVTPMVVVIDARGRARYRSFGVPSLDQLRGALAAVQSSDWTLWADGSPPTPDQALAERNMSMLRIVPPSGSEGTYTVVVDGRARGTAPVQEQLPAGQHIVMLRRPDVPSSTFHVYLPAGAQLNLEVPADMLTPGAHIGIP